MKKNLLLAIFSIGLLASCGNDGPTKNEKADAKKMCDCMNKKIAEKGDVAEEIIAATSADDYALCALDLIFEEIDPSASGFSQAISSSCPEYSEIHKEYIREFNED